MSDESNELPDIIMTYRVQCNRYLIDSFTFYCFIDSTNIRANSIVSVKSVTWTPDISQPNEH
jgi:hypothetical protein